jgi:hypothetical protein
MIFYAHSFLKGLPKILESASFVAVLNWLGSK